jgi:hypothetical protein
MPRSLWINSVVSGLLYSTVRQLDITSDALASVARLEWFESRNLQHYKLQSAVLQTHKKPLSG